MKNVVMRIVINIRERKQRPKLFEVMKVYRKKLYESNGAVHDIKTQFQEKFFKLYSGEVSDDEDDDKDEKYKKLIENMTRIKQ